MSVNSYLGDMEKYKVKCSDGKHLYINPQMVKQQNISDRRLELLKKMHYKRRLIEIEMKNSLDDKKALRRLFREWKDNEYDIQEAWGFDRNPDYHMCFLLPGCDCPKIDNYDCWGTDVRYINSHCVYHGSQKE